MPTVRPFSTSVSALAVLVLAYGGAGCSMQPAVKPTPAAPQSGAHNEVAELEKTIADTKARLRTAYQAADSTAESPTPMSAGTGPSVPSVRCEGVCRAAQEICTASRRICRIATEQPEPAITTSCQRAERECTDASALCAQCH